MTTVHRRVGHQIAAIRFPRPFLRDRPARSSTLECTCTHKLDAPTPELLDLEWQAHRREVSDNDTARRIRGRGNACNKLRARAKAPGYLAGGRFE